MDEADEAIYLFVNNEENQEEHMVHNSLSPGYAANIESDEDLSHSADFKTESNANKNAVWTKKATMAMLSLYEANIQMLTDIGKKSKVWKKVSDGLRGLCIQVTADQVKWKFNRLYNKYKKCINNNNKSGRAHRTFEYYEQFENIFHKKKTISTPHTFSSLILSTDETKRKHHIIGSKNINKTKRSTNIISKKNLRLVDESPRLKKNLVVGVKKTARNQKHTRNAVWTKKATKAMLSLYEANIQVLTDIGKKSMVWKKISEGLKDFCIQVTADQVKWKFNRLYNKYKECIKNNNRSGRDHMTFEYYEKFEQFFHKGKNASLLSIDETEIKNDNEVIESKDIKSKEANIISENNLPPVDESSEHKTTPVADISTARNQQNIEIMELLQNIQENQKIRDKNMTEYLKMKEKEMELKKKAIDVRETEMQIKRDVASEKLKFNEKKHEDWLSIEKLKCELLKKLLKNGADSEDSDQTTKS